jgi:hypothetical protein
VNAKESGRQFNDNQGDSSFSGTRKCDPTTVCYKVQLPPLLWDKNNEAQQCAINPFINRRINMDKEKLEAMDKAIQKAMEPFAEEEEYDLPESEPAEHCRHCAIQTLKDMGDTQSLFLSKKVGRGLATVTWEQIHPQCLRLTIIYRGQVWKIRVPTVRDGN